LIHTVSVLFKFPFILPKKSFFVKVFLVDFGKNQEEK